MSKHAFFTAFIRCIPELLLGVKTTIAILLGAISIGLSAGTLFGVLLSKNLRIRGVSTAVATIAFILRAIPAFVQILLCYFVVPDLIGWSASPVEASIVALGLCSSGYVAQIIKGGINNVAEHQWESARVLGLNKAQACCLLIFPQVWRAVLPMLSNELDALLKSTALAATIGALDITKRGMNIVSREMNPMPVYLSIALIYVLLSLLLIGTIRYLEKRAFHAKRQKPLVIQKEP